MVPTFKDLDPDLVREIVRDECQKELLRDGGLTDHCRVAALNAVCDGMRAIERTIRKELREELLAELGLDAERMPE